MNIASQSGRPEQNQSLTSLITSLLDGMRPGEIAESLTPATLQQQRGRRKPVRWCCARVCVPHVYHLWTLL